VGDPPVVCPGGPGGVGAVSTAFVDTSAWYAAADRDDASHARAAAAQGAFPDQAFSVHA
jgi:hypothetical protein